jgi:hypothetical protein
MIPFAHLKAFETFGLSVHGFADVNAFVVNLTGANRENRGF